MRHLLDAPRDLAVYADRLGLDRKGYEEVYLDALRLTCSRRFVALFEAVTGMLDHRPRIDAETVYEIHRITRESHASWPPHKHLYGAQHESYTLWWSGDRSEIHARERQTESGCYPTAKTPSYTRWHAIRTSDLRTQSHS